MALDPLIHQATRLRIMAALFRNREASFTRLRDGLGLTDGNLGSHAAALEKAGYLASRRALTPLGFEVRYRITRAGSDAFIAYTAELNDILRSASAPEQEDARDRGEEREDERDGARGLGQAGRVLGP